MNLEEALKVADEAVFNKTGNYLTDTQKLIFRESWNNKTYDEIADEFHSAFNLSPDIINLSWEEVKALGNYLYANYLIIQCKQASVRVSAATREGIEERMLLVPSN